MSNTFRSRSPGSNVYSTGTILPHQPRRRNQKPRPEQYNPKEVFNENGTSRNRNCESQNEQDLEEINRMTAQNPEIQTSNQTEISNAPLQSTSFVPGTHFSFSQVVHGTLTGSRYHTASTLGQLTAPSLSSYVGLPPGLHARQIDSPSSLWGNSGNYGDCSTCQAASLRNSRKKKVENKENMRGIIESETTLKSQLFKEDLQRGTALMRFEFPISKKLLYANLIAPASLPHSHQQPIPLRRPHTLLHLEILRPPAEVATPKMLLEITRVLGIHAQKPSSHLQVLADMCEPFTTMIEKGVTHVARVSQINGDGMAMLRTPEKGIVIKIGNLVDIRIRQTTQLGKPVDTQVRLDMLLLPPRPIYQIST
ncbi:hypothetical protein IFR05_015147 [Cadophora sp. M221]|nr:hypothetical protein IFR05_015147 [Cadophora sp. M221]